MVGEQFENNSGQKYVVVQREGKSKSGNIRWLIRFLDTDYETVVEKVQMKRGKIKDRYAPDIFGVGFVGDIDVVNNKQAYNVWHKMLGRCYSESNKSYKDYGAKGVYVSKRWHSFENFVNDIPSIDGYDELLWEAGLLNLDKDAKQVGVQFKRYSLETCTFMSKAQNSALVDREHRKFDFVGIAPDGTKHNGHGIREFARQHGLTYERVRLCLKGEAKTHKGWTFQYE